jgi:hypothetical protein
MALLRQCLQELRVKRHEWTSSDEPWSGSLPRHAEDRREPIHVGAPVAPQHPEPRPQALGAGR